MIEYLEKLIEQRKWKEAIILAEQLLLKENNSSLDLLAVNCAILRARLAVGELHGAIVAGQLALQLGMELEAWDYYGHACVNLGATHMALLQYGSAIEVLNCYLEHLNQYLSAQQFEALVRYDLGLVLRGLGNDHDAATALEGAIEAAERLGNSRHAHGIRQALTDLYLKSGELRRIPRLLAKCSHYLRNHPNAHMIQDSKLYYTKLRAEYAMVTERPLRAMYVALGGMQKAEGMVSHQAGFHILLSKVACQLGSFTEALGHALAARVHAIKCHRHDLESESVGLVNYLFRNHPQTVDELGHFYFTEGIDLVFNQEVHKLIQEG